MLVISRQQDQVIDFPECGISISFLSTSSRKARVGIEAPKNVTIMRRELSDRMAHATETNQSDQAEIIPISDLRFQRNIHRLNECVEALAHIPAVVGDVQSRQLLMELQKTLSSTDLDVAIDLQRPPVLKATKRGKALLVDDNANEARLLAGFLRMRDFDVEIASDGFAALEYLEENELPDVVLLDMEMPRMDGASTIRMIRESESHHTLKVFAVTGSTPEESGITVDDHGVNGWFQKPVDPEVLVSTLSKGLRKQADEDQDSRSIVCEGSQT